METIGTRIKDARVAAKISRERLARDLDVNARTVYRWEMGENSPTAIALQQIAELTDRPVEWFYGEVVA